MLILLPFIVLSLVPPLTYFVFTTYSANLPHKFLQDIYKQRENYYLPVIFNLYTFQKSCEIDPKFATPLLQEYLQKNLQISFQITCNDLLNNFDKVKERIIYQLVSRDYSTFVASYNQVFNQIKERLSVLLYPLGLFALLVAIYIYKVLQEDYKLVYLLFLFASILIATGIAFVINATFFLPADKVILTSLAATLFNIGLPSIGTISSDINSFYLIGLGLMIAGVLIIGLTYYWAKYKAYIW